MASMHKKSLIATAAIFCCRFTGLLREVVYTALFGATGALDAFLTAFRVPNMLRDMFAEGALSQSFTSVMSKVEKSDGPQAAWSMANMVVSQLISLMVCIVAAGVLLAGLCMQQLYPAKARLVVEPVPAVAPAEPAAATFTGLRADGDGLPVAHFSYNAELPATLTPESVVRLSAVEKLQPGDKVALAADAVPAGQELPVLRVESRHFIDLAANLSLGLHIAPCEFT